MASGHRLHVTTSNMPAPSDVIFVSYRAALPDGDGGNHRTYQILLDLQDEFGVQHVHVMTLDDWFAQSMATVTKYRTSNHTRPGLRSRVQRRVLRMTENPYRLLTREGWSHHVGFATRGVLPQDFYTEYVARAKACSGLAACVVDHSVFDQVRVANTALSIPTVIASQNFESLDVSRFTFDSRVSVQRAGVDFANELSSLAQFDERFAISKVEASALTGVGLSCKLYPYVPRGQVRETLVASAAMRKTTSIRRGLFVLIGSAFHAPTRRSMEWFVQHAVQDGLPRGVHIVVAGSNVGELLADRVTVPQLEVRGRLSTVELTALLVASNAALVPQRMGFGALTRLPELACAGVPVVTFPHAAYALDVPPGVQVLEDDSWSSLVDAMCAAMERPPSVDRAAYESWERRQPRPIGPALRHAQSMQRPLA